MHPHTNKQTHKRMDGTIKKDDPKSEHEFNVEKWQTQVQPKMF